MSLLQIAEPSQSANPHEHRFALGIDLGTTRSMVAVVRSGRAAVIPADNSENKDELNINGTANKDDTLLPSVVYYGDTQSAPITGHKALEHFNSDPSNTIISAKRFMGRSMADIKFSHPYTLKADDTDNNAMPSFVTAQGDISPVTVSADILRTLQRRAKAALPFDSIEGAVITVPAYFDEGQRQATKDAAKLAGLNVLRLLNEPTAAAVAYGLDKNPQGDEDVTLNNQHYLIYDLGGGTFDVSLLKMNNGVFEVLATGGNSALGGDDIDRLIMGWLVKQAGHSPKDLTAQQKSNIARQAERYKQLLSDTDSVSVDINLPQSTDKTAHSSSSMISWQGELDNITLADIAQPITKRTFAICEQVLRDAKLNHDDLDAIILVGGSTRMPIIKQAVEDFFGKHPLAHLNPDEVVALGAAQVAEQLIKEDKSDNLLLLDVTPLSLGLETMGGLVEVLIPRNTPIPVTKRQTFTTYQDGQTGMVIHVVQGERDTVAHSRSLGRFELYGIPPMKAGLARIEVTFDIDANGQLSVSAYEGTTGAKSDIKITPSYGLSEEQQEQLLSTGFENAEKDMLSRSLLETKVEAEREVLALASALHEYESLLNDDECTELQQAMQQLSDTLNRNALSGSEQLDGLSFDDLKALKDTINAHQATLKPLSDLFASRIMNQSVQKSLSGTSVQKWTQ